MVQVALKKKESRLLWEILIRGIQATDEAVKKAPSSDDAYRKLRGKVLGAWRSGMIVGGLRPKRRIYEIVPNDLLKDTELALLKKATKRARAKAKREIAVPHQASRGGKARGG
jgi:hypothetical protein